MDLNEITKKLFLAFCFLSGVACSKAPNELNVESALTVDCKQVMMHENGGRFETTVRSTHKWSVFSEDTWISVENTDAKYKESYIAIKVDKNLSTKQRIGTVTVKSDYQSETITIVQDARKELILEPSYFRVKNDGDTIQIRVITNLAYNIKVPSEWILDDTREADMDDAKDEFLHTFVIFSNDTYDDRTGRIEFEASGVVETATVFQSQINGMILSEPTVEIDDSGGEIPVEIKANVNYIYELEEGVDWITEVSPKTKSLIPYHHTFAIAPNPYRMGRTATIKFISDDPKLNDVLTIKQFGRTYVLKISHSNERFVLPAINGENVVGTVDWGDDQIESYSSFLSHVYSSSGNHTVILSVKNSESVKFENIKAVSRIDLSEFE